jgi:hypothetical protein
MIFLLGKTLLNSYYYLSPETLYPPGYKTLEQEFKLPKFDIPEGCPDLLRETPEQRSAYKKRRYDYEIQSIQNQAAHQVRSSLVYLVLLLLSFFGHLLLAKKSNAKNT